MASSKLLEVIRAEVGETPEALDAESLDRILIEPHQEVLAEAIVADAIDAVPIIGDLGAMVRQRRAERDGIELPAQPAYIENTISDLPPPFDTVGDILVSQNVLLYLHRKHGVDLMDDLEERNEKFTDRLADTVEGITPNRA